MSQKQNPAAPFAGPARPLPIVPYMPVKVADRPPEMKYFGGALIQSVEVAVVYWGTFWKAPTNNKYGPGIVTFMDQFFKVIVNSAYMDMLWEYSTDSVSISRGRALPSAVFDAYDPPPQITDADIQSELMKWIGQGVVPPAGPDRLYFIFFPPGVSITGPVVQGQPTGQSCQPLGFFGYHHLVNPQVRYCVLAFQPCSGIPPFPNASDIAFSNLSLSVAASHELAEAVTDPEPGTGWVDPNNLGGAEVSDLCPFSPPTLVSGYHVEGVYSNNQDGCFKTTVSPPWSHAIGAADLLSKDVGSVRAAANLDGRLEVFVTNKDHHQLYHKWQTSPRGGWHPQNAGDAELLSLDASFFDVAANADGRLEVFIRGIKDGYLYHKWQTSPGGPWSHAVPDAARLYDKPTGGPGVVLNDDGRLEVFFGNTEDDTFYHKWQTSPGGVWHPQNAGDAVPLSLNVRFFNVGKNRDGRLEVFLGSTNDDKLYHKWQTSPGGPWSHAVPDAALLSLNVKSAIVGSNEDGRLEVFILGGDGCLYHKWQTSPGGAWSHPVPAADLLAADVSFAAVAANRDGRLEVFYRGDGGHLYHKWQAAPNSSTWYPPFPREAPLSRDVSGMATAMNADGRLQIFVRGSNDPHLYTKYQRS